MKPIRFLILEDDPQFRAKLVKQLNESEGCTVIGQADNVKDGFDAIVTEQPDAILLDIALFGGSAFDILRQLKAHQLPIPPVVIITANAKFEFAAEAVDVCGSSLVKIVGKPFWTNWKKEYPAIRAGILARLQPGQPKPEEVESTVMHTGDSIYVRSSQQTHRIHPADIVLLDVKGEGLTRIILRDGRIVIVRRTLNLLMEVMPSFILRVNRFNAVNMNRLMYINHEDDTLFLDGYPEAITIGSPYMQHIRDYITG
jgi:DNA-binding LytR/AlgR family response regulator